MKGSICFYECPLPLPYEWLILRDISLIGTLSVQILCIFHLTSLVKSIQNQRASFVYRFINLIGHAGISNTSPHHTMLKGLVLGKSLDGSLGTTAAKHHCPQVVPLATRHVTKHS